MKETELYLPLKEFFENMGYAVKGEVKNCDFAAQKDDSFVAVEMKLRFCLKLVYQAMERQKVAKEVYVCIPRSEKSGRDRANKDMLALLERLEIGLITVALDSPVKTVEVLLEAGEKSVKGKKAQRFAAEFESRSLDLNLGGMTKAKIITAYCERNIKMAALCLMCDEVSTKFARELGCDDKDTRLMRDNYYGWFEKIGRGVYRISEKGKEEIKNEKYKPLFDFYTNSFKEKGI